MKSNPVTRWATRDDIEAYSPLRNKPTIRALCIEVDGEIVALGGLAFSQSRWIMFCDVQDEGRRYKVALMKAAKRMIEEAGRMGIRYVYATASPSERNSVRWVESLGFKIDPRTPDIYRWSADG